MYLKYERVLHTIFSEFSDKQIDETFQRILFEAMDKYGSDKPDLRNPLIMQDAAELFRNAILNTAGVVESGGSV